MNRIYLCAALCGALFVAGCGGGSLDDQVTKIQAKANQLCGYEDKIGAVAKIVAVGASGIAPAGVVIVTGIDATAKAICDAIKTHATVNAAAGSCPQVNGICVK